MRGVDMPAVLPAKRDDVAKRGHMSLWVQGALRDGPQPFRAIVDAVALKRPELPREAVCQRTGQALDRLKRKGLVAQDFGPDGCLWRVVKLAQ